jgi:hypothetical protein
MRANVAGSLLWWSVAVLPVAWVRSTAGQESPAPAQSGSIAGTVIDRTNRQPIIEAGVELVGKGKTVQTDLDGKYRITLPPGTYELRIYAPSYQAVRLKDLQVVPGDVTKADAALAPSGAAGVDVVEVFAKRKKAAEASQLAARKEAPVVMDVISRETMAKTSGSEASDVVQRAPAVTVKEDRFVFVRGLSERYTSALLNGSRLPSPDPLRRAVPLDLFPSEFLDSIGIVKSYSPDLPGDFSGGLIELELREVPETLTYSAGISAGANTQTTGQDFLTYKGTSSRDYFAAGDRFRHLRVPDVDLTSAPLEERLAAGRGLKDVWSVEVDEAPPNFGGNLSIGNTIGPFGFQFGALISNEWLTRNDQLRRQLGRNPAEQPGDPPTVGIQQDLRADSGFHQAKLGAVLTSGWKLAEGHQLSLRSFVYQTGVDETTAAFGQVKEGENEPPAALSVLRYTLESLGYGQLAGEHRFTDWFLVDWRTVLSRTERDEPDTRLTQYYADSPRPPFVFTFNGEEDRGGFRFENKTYEWLSDSAVDFSIPFKTRLPATDAWSDLPAKFKFGPAYSYREREFDQREFRYSPTVGAVDLTLPPEEILAPQNLVPGIVDFQEATDIEDSFDATQEIIAGYGLLELPILRDRLRVIGGARVEHSLIRLDTGLITDAQSGLCPPEPGSSGFLQCIARFQKATLDPLPAVNLVYSPIRDMNLRFSYGGSVARPEFRELAPARFPKLPGERERRGNPNLVQTDITSWDARWEWFFSPLELVSAGFFYKDLQAPIEPVTVIIGTDPVDTWVNGGDGELIGFELEGRKDLGFIHPWLKPLSVIANFTWSDSTVTIPPQEFFGLTTLQTSAERPLAGQSPFVANGALEYSQPDWFTGRLLYYTADRSIFTAGFNELPDIYFERRDQLDAVLIFPLQRWLKAPFTTRLSVENIFNSPFVFTQGPLDQERYTNGVKFTLSLSYTH